jgi:hypothetical protein
MWVPANALGPILKKPWFTDLMTVTNVHYEIYRDMSNVNVSTLRFNLNNSDYSENRMLDMIMKYVMNKFKENTDIIGIIDYNAPRYYIFTANSNQRVSTNTKETRFLLTRDQLYLFARRALQINIPELEIDFKDSNLVISSVIAIVFTFTSV